MKNARKQRKISPLTARKRTGRGGQNARFQGDPAPNRTPATGAGNREGASRRTGTTAVVTLLGLIVTGILTVSLLSGGAQVEGEPESGSAESQTVQNLGAQQAGGATVAGGSDKSEQIKINIKPYFTGPGAMAFGAGRYQVAGSLFYEHMGREKDPEKKWAAGLLAAVSWFNNGEPAQAAQLLKTITPDLPPAIRPYAHGIRARALLRCDEPGEALRELERLEELGAPPCVAGGDMLYAKALALVKQGRYQETVHLLGPQFTVVGAGAGAGSGSGSPLLATQAPTSGGRPIPSTAISTQAGPELISLMVTALEETGDRERADQLRRVIYFHHPGSWSSIYRGTPLVNTVPADPTPGELLERANAYYEAHQHQQALTTLRQISTNLPAALKVAIQKEEVASLTKATPMPDQAPAPDRGQGADPIGALIGAKTGSGGSRGSAGAGAALKTDPSQPTVEELCQAVFMAGHTYTKMRRHSRAWPILADLARVPRCDATVSPDRVLYHGGRSAGRAGRHKEAVALFTRLATEHPNSNLADDAWLLMAEIHMDEANTHKKRNNRAKHKAATEQARQALQTLVDKHPQGDMREEAQFRLAWEPYMAGDLDGALKVLDATEALNLPERHYYARGRTKYWRGRILLKKGDTTGAVEAWQQVIREHPLSYYALLAANRVAETGFRGAPVMEPRPAGAGAGETGAGDIRIAASQMDIHLERAITFMRLGLDNGAAVELNSRRKTMDALAGGERDGGPGMDTDGDGNGEEKALWLLAALYHEAGIYNQSHNIPRRQIPQFADHPPTSPGALHRWQLAYPRAFREQIDLAALGEEIPPMLLTALVREESGFTPSIESWANAIGLAQLLVPTARDVAKPSERPINASTLRDPQLNLHLGARFLGSLINRFGHFGLAIAGYNAGGGAVSRWMTARGHLDFDEFVETIPYEQTRNYTKRVTESYGRYSYLYQENQAPEQDPNKPTPAPLTIPNTIKK